MGKMSPRAILLSSFLNFLDTWDKINWLRKWGPLESGVWAVCSNKLCQVFALQPYDHAIIKDEKKLNPLTSKRCNQHTYKVGRLLPAGRGTRVGANSYKTSRSCLTANILCYSDFVTAYKVILVYFPSCRYSRPQRRIHVNRGLLFIPRFQNDHDI